MSALYLVDPSDGGVLREDQITEAAINDGGHLVYIDDHGDFYSVGDDGESLYDLDAAVGQFDLSVLANDADGYADNALDLDEMSESERLVFEQFLDDADDHRDAVANYQAFMEAAGETLGAQAAEAEEDAEYDAEMEVGDWFLENEDIKPSDEDWLAFLEDGNTFDQAREKALAMRAAVSAERQQQGAPDTPTYATMSDAVNAAFLPGGELATERLARQPASGVDPARLAQAKAKPLGEQTWEDKRVLGYRHDTMADAMDEFGDQLSAEADFKRAVGNRIEAERIIARQESKGRSDG